MYFGPIQMDGRPSFCWAETFSTSPLKPQNEIQQYLTGSKIATSSNKFVVFFGPIENTRWPPRPLVAWDIFDFSSETAEWNSIKHDKKQDLNVLYLGCFRANRKTKIAAQCLIDRDIFDFFSKRNSKKLDKKQNLKVLYQVVFLGKTEKPRLPSGLWLAETFSTSPLKPLNGIFDFSSEATERNSMKRHRKQDLNFLYQLCVFRDDQYTKIATLADPWKRWHIVLRYMIVVLWASCDQTSWMDGKNP